MKYLKHYKKLHEDKGGYGATGESMAGFLYRWVKKIQPESILDYGCGKSILVELLSYK